MISVLEIYHFFLLLLDDFLREDLKQVDQIGDEMICIRCVFRLFSNQYTAEADIPSSAGNARLVIDKNEIKK